MHMESIRDVFLFLNNCSLDLADIKRAE